VLKNASGDRRALGSSAVTDVSDLPSHDYHDPVNANLARELSVQAAHPPWMPRDSVSILDRGPADAAYAGAMNDVSSRDVVTSIARLIER
jgi:hypothetical protein